MIKDLQDWWYFNVYGYERDMAKLVEVLETSRETMTFNDAQLIQKTYPKIIPQVRREEDQVYYSITFKEYAPNPVEFCLHSS